MSTDIHNHVIPPSVLALVRDDPQYGVTVTDGIWRSKNIGEFPLIDAWYDPAAKLREMDGKEIDRAVLSVAPKPLYYYEIPLDGQQLMAETANEGMAEFCTHEPTRLSWMAHVPLAFPDAAVEVLEKAVAAGAKGIQIGTSAAGQRLDDPAYDVLWEAVTRLGVAVFLHPAYESDGPEHQGHALGVVQGLPIEVTNALQRIVCSGVFDRHPELRMVAALGGGFFPYVAGRLRHYSTYQPELAGAPADAWSYVGRLKFDTHLHDPVALRFLIEKAGPANVMVGTDCSFPSCTPHPMVELRAAVGDDETALAAIADANAMEWFG